MNTAIALRLRRLRVVCRRAAFTGQRWQPLGRSSPKRTGHLPPRTWCEFQLSSNLTTSRTTSPSYRNPHPAAKLSTPRKPNSQWPSNRLPAYVLPLGVLGSREQGTNDWNRCSAVRSCSTFPLPRVRGELVAGFRSFFQLCRSSGQCAPRTEELG